MAAVGWPLKVLGIFLQPCAQVNAASSFGKPHVLDVPVVASMVSNMVVLHSKYSYSIVDLKYTKHNIGNDFGLNILFQLGKLVQV